MARSSRTFMCREVSVEDHRPWAVVEMCASHPVRDASVVIMRDGASWRKRTPEQRLEGTIHHRRGSLTLKGMDRGLFKACTFGL